MPALSALNRLRSWIGVTLAATLALTLFDGILLQRRFLFFSGGFLAGNYLRAPLSYLAFATASLASDALLTGTITAAVLWLLKHSRLHLDARIVLAFFSALLPGVLYDIVTYEVLSYLGTVDVGLILNLGQGRVQEALAQAAPYLTRPAWLAAAGVCGVAATTWLVQRRAWKGQTLRYTHRRADVAAVALMGLMAQGALQLIDADVAWGLRWKASGRLANTIFDFVLDFDRDGYSSLSRPPDEHPFDASRHPFAFDTPGNDVDENGIGGDLPAPYASFDEPVIASPRFGAQPDIVLIMLEGVRGDAIGRTLDGRSVTPTLSGLAAGGASVPLAFAHVASTSPSRWNTMTGRLTPAAGAPSLVDDFNVNGYQTVYVSGQDESFGMPRFDVGFERATVHWDARRDRSARYTTFGTPGSLAVPADRVVEEVRQILERSIARDRPLFLYVNFHDTHFPYHHDGIRPMLSSTVVHGRALESRSAAEVRRMYLNTLANVDRAIAEVLQLVRERRGVAPAVIATSDHGESLFENGRLGHGLALDEVQHRVPLIVAGLDVEIPSVMGLTRLRGLVHEALRRPATGLPTRLRAADAEAVFVYTGTLTKPSQVGWFGAQDRLVVDLRDRVISGAAFRRTPLRDVPPAWQSRFLQLVWSWEARALAERRSGQARDRR